VAVAAVRAGDAVAVAQVHHDAGADGLLAGIQVDEAGDVAGAKSTCSRSSNSRIVRIVR
jgi:hypothetical protein